MIQVVWEFVVRPDTVGAFLRAYGPSGDWEKLFTRYAGFRGTTLLRDVARPHRFLTVDSWESVAQRAAMLAHAGDDYARVDRACAELTESERELGTFEVTA